jgi:hypothetical protein
LLRILLLPGSAAARLWLLLRVPAPLLRLLVSRRALHRFRRLLHLLVRVR